MTSRAAPLRAAIDIGTNTLLALVGRVSSDGAVERVADLATITRLGAGVDQTRRLAPDAMERALAALREFTARARALGATSVSAVATSAVRDAENRDEFLRAARAIAGDDVDVISGEREAELTFAGAGVGTGVRDGARALVFDVGGGSTELVAGPLGGRAEFRTSLDVGSVRLTERCIAHDPPATDELARIDALLARALEALGAPPAHEVLLGLAATVTTLAAVDLGMSVPDRAALHGRELTLEAVERASALFASLPLARRQTLPGLDPRRADVITAGARVVRAVLRWSGRTSLVVSDGGVRMGLLLERSRMAPR